MSELINNNAQRQQKLKELIHKLHDGATVESVKEEFSQLTEGISPSEITEMEQALVDEGMPVEEIQRLCDVHASVFKGSIKDIHSDDTKPSLAYEKGHPINTFMRENRAIEDLLDYEISNSLISYISSDSKESKYLLIKGLEKLATIDYHYSRKENLLFPYMENYNITAPPQVMWGVDDEIRGKIKDVLISLKEGEKSAADIKESVFDVIRQVREMIFKEEEIMFPMVVDLLTKEEWSNIQKSSADIGFTLINYIMESSNNVSEENPETTITDYVSKDSQSKVAFDAGTLTAEEINSILNTVPLDMTFVGADNRVKYFTQGKERTFDRPLTIIGREVKYCHPPKSVHLVEEIVEDLRSGKKEYEDFWIKMGEAFVYIRYFAVRNKQGAFLGVLEVTQNIKHITELEGEKRLMS